MLEKVLDTQEPLLTSVSDDDDSLTALFRAADIDVDQRIDLLTQQLTHLEEFRSAGTKGKHARTLAQECAAYSHKPWACPLLRELRKATNTASARGAAKEAEAAAKRRGSVHAGGGGTRGAFDAVLAQSSPSRWRRRRRRPEVHVCVVLVRSLKHTLRKKNA